MWGIDPCAGPRRQAAHWDPREAPRAAHRHRAVLESSCPSRSAFPSSSYLRRFITEAASGAHTCRLPWGSELGSWTPSLLRQVLLVSGSARLSHMPDMSYSQICHTPELVFWPSGRGG